MKYKTYIIIVSYNGMKWLPECLESTKPYPIIVVDNNSNDGTQNYIRSNHSEIILLEQKENLGFGKANNIGMSYALKQNADFVFLLNQDAFVENDTVEKLIKVANNNVEYGIISPIHLNEDGTTLESYFATFMEMKSTPYFFSDFIIKEKRKEIYKSKFINAAAWLIPKKTLSEVGGFDPIFWHYGEDDNYCQRIIYHHYKIGVVPEAFIRHDSNIRVTPPDYLFSDRFYADYIRLLQVKYANLNMHLSEKAVSYEKKKIVRGLIENCLNFKFYPLKNYFKQYNLIDKTFEGINTSRKINKKKAPHYL